MGLAAAWDTILGSLASVFTQPGFEVATALLTAWVLTPGRHTLSRLLLASSDRAPEHGYQRFAYLVRAGAWQPARWWDQVLFVVVTRLVPIGPITLLVDDTLEHKSGRAVTGAGMWRDAVRSTKKHAVTAWGLNVVVVAVLVPTPWGGEPLALPVAIRLHRKGAATPVDLASAMIDAIAQCLPGRRLRVVTDGAYASLARHLPARAALVSRMRRGAAIFEPAPPRTGRRGRPRKRGARLPAPEHLAASLPAGAWLEVEVTLRTKPVRRQIYARTVLWYKALKERPVLMVFVRDPDGHQPIDIFFSTDLTLLPKAVVELYANRWPIEETFRETKQVLGVHQPQSWTHEAPERALDLGFGLFTLVWTCFLTTPGAQAQPPDRSWYPDKHCTSFLDAVAALRRALWFGRISMRTPARSPVGEILATMVDLLSYAA